QITQTQSQPLISVIIPVYNVAKYLNRCMKSVCGQTYRNLEILMVDDGSTDESATMCDKWAAADSRIRLIRQHNQGLSAARNTALEVAKGDWIAFVDSDDWIETDMYEGLCQIALEHDADIVACGHIREYTKRNKSKVRNVAGETCTIDADEAMKMIVKDRRLQNHVWSKIYRRKLFNEVRFPVGEIYEDIAVSHLLLHQANRVVLVDKAFYHYRIRHDSLSRVPSINADKEAQYFAQITKQSDYVLKNVEWKDAGFYLHRRAVRCIGHLLLLPKSAETDKKVEVIIATMRSHRFYYTVRFTPIIFLKRLWILHHLRSYRHAYRLIERFRSKPRFGR
ncbi:MAG: glycosyltransferase, partial [Muribaculaceae bacterium]